MDNDNEIVNHRYFTIIFQQSLSSRLISRSNTKLVAETRESN